MVVALQITNSALCQAMISELQPDLSATAADLDRLNLSVQPFVEKNIQSMLDCIDDLMNEQQKASATSCTRVYSAVAVE